MSEELKRLFQETHEIIRKLKRKALGEIEEIEILAVAEEMENHKPEEENE